MSALRRPLRALAPFAVAACLAACLAACGGGGDGDRGPAARDASGNVITSGGDEQVTAAANERYAAAVAVYDRAVAEGFTAARCAEIRGAFDGAIEAQGGGFAEAQYMAGLAAQKCDDREAAERYLARALELWPQFCKARVALGVLQQETGRDDEARRNFEQARNDAPRTCHEAYVNIAILQRREGTEATEREALANLRRALAIDASYLPAFNEMALLYLEGARENPQALDLAALVCRQAQLIDRNYAPIYNTWGLIHVRKGDIIEALRMFERARALDARFFEAFMNFGQITLSFRGYEDAKAAFGRAVELKPDSYDAHIGLGAALRGLREYAEAERHYERARELDANRPEAYFNLGVLHQDYVLGEQSQIADQIRILRESIAFYDQFVSKAGGAQELASTVETVTRTCREQTSGRRRRNACNPGRKQRAQQTIDALEETIRFQQQMEQQPQSSGGGDPSAS